MNPADISALAHNLYESKGPKAIAEAFRQGNLGIMDYYNIQNVKADTHMRNRIGAQKDETREEP